MDSDNSNKIKEKGAAMRLRLSDKWQDFRERMRHKHRLMVLDTDTLQEKFSMELTGLNLFTYLGISVIVLIVLTSLLIAFTPLRNLVPGYIKPELKEQTIKNAQIIDSLEVIIAQHEQHIAIIQDVISGKEMRTEKDTVTQSVEDEEIVYRHTRADSLLRQQIEQQRKAEKEKQKHKNRSIKCRILLIFPSN